MPLRAPVRAAFPPPRTFGNRPGLLASARQACKNQAVSIHARSPSVMTAVSVAPEVPLAVAMEGHRRVLDEAWARLLEDLGRRFAAVPELEPVHTILSHYLARTGKRLRPLLLLASHEMFQSEPSARPSAALANAAAAVELFHAFSLVHDDLVDQSDHRRGQPALHRRFEHGLGVPSKAGTDLALVVGDLLFGFAVERLLDERLPHGSAATRYFLRISQETGLGESLELLHQHSPIHEVAADAILRTYRLKTTRYTFAAPLVLGAMLAGADTLDRTRLEAVADPLGLAFQLENDLHELTLPPTDAARHGWDLLAGVKTLPLRRLYERIDAADCEWLDQLLTGHTPAVGDCARLFSLLESTGVLADLRTEISGAFAEAQRRLDASGWPPSRRLSLHALIDFIRNHSHHSEAGS
jgi:geranylgeranyl diphosphate synthase, type I